MDASMLEMVGQVVLISGLLVAAIFTPPEPASPAKVETQPQKQLLPRTASDGH